MRTFIAVLSILVLSISGHSFARTEAIAVIVNDDAITVSDVNDRLHMVLSSSGLPDNQDTRQRLTGQVVASLVEEQIKLQEAENLDITVGEQEVQGGFSNLAQMNNMTSEQFREVIRRAGINIASMYRQIESQIAWGKVVQAKLRPQVKIADKDIDIALERIENNIGKPEYLVAEIFLPVEDPREDSDVRQLASRLVSDIRAGKVPFFKVAQQFSKAPGAPQGGDLGWVQSGQLDDDLADTLEGMKNNTVSSPVRCVGGYHILFLRDQRVMEDSRVPSREQIMENIGVQRLERMQRRYLMDLKAAAFIENRLES